MKKLILVLVAMMAVAVQAETTYWAAIETTPYDGDESDGANIGNYSVYYCDVNSANSAFGGSSVNAIEQYIMNNFSAAKAMATTFDSVVYEDGEYHIVNYVDEAFDSTAYVAFAIYGDDAYRVYGYNSGNGDSSAKLTPVGQLVFNEDYAANGTVGDWQVVPEPTSGLLLLLGLAGLALKRKRA